jgi:hypothetical protein
MIIPISGTIVSTLAYLFNTFPCLQCAPSAAIVLRQMKKPRRQQMITLYDCRAFCDVDQAVVARLARQEQLPEVMAIACAQSRLMRARMTQTPTLVTRVPAAYRPLQLAA